MDVEYVKHYIHQLQQKQLDEGKVFYPEAPETLLNQYKRVLTGKKACMLWHKLPANGLPHELLANTGILVEWIDSDEGAYMYNPKMIGHRDVMTHISRGTQGILLGYGITSVPSVDENTFALRLINKDGVEKEAVSCTSKQIEKVTDALMEFYEEGDVLVPQDRIEFKKERLRNFILTKR